MSSSCLHEHGHGHEHSHVPSVSAGNERKVLAAFVITFLFMIVEAVGGWLSGSLALLADAGHMLTDSAALALAYAAFRFGRKQADEKRTFGYFRLEVLAGFFNAITLFAIVGWILFEAYERLLAPSPVLAGPMMVVAALGLGVNLIVLWILSRGESNHVNIKGALLHVMGDLLGSIGALGAAGVIALTGWTPIDPLLSVLVSVLILRSAWSLLRKSLNILLEGAPENASPEAIERHLLQAVSGLKSVNHVHIWSITSGRILATLHVRPHEDKAARAVVKAVGRELSVHFGIVHATIAIDWNDEGQEDPSCCLGED